VLLFLIALFVGGLIVGALARLALPGPEARLPRRRL